MSESVFREILPKSLDEPVISYLCSVVSEDQLPVSESDLYDRIGELLISYEVASSENDAVSVCGKLFAAMSSKGLISLVGDSDKKTNVNSNVPAAKKLSAPVCIEETLPVSERPKPREVKSQPKTTQQLYEEIVTEEETKVYNDSETRRQEKQEVCEMCDRPMPLTFHHLIPKTTHAKYKAKGYGAATLAKGIWVCRPCHSAVHRLIDEDTLAESFNTLELLLEDERVAKWAKYCSKQRVNRSKADGHTQKLRYAK